MTNPEQGIWDRCQHCGSVEWQLINVSGAWVCIECAYIADQDANRLELDHALALLAASHTGGKPCPTK